MILIKLSSVLNITDPTPFSYTGKKGLVAGFECHVQGFAADGGLAKVQVRGATVDQLKVKVASLGLKKGEAAEIPIRLFEVGKDQMYAVNAA